ncbi:VTT domain-containing protein [Glaciecola sp. XM2]|nr:VTT domain-containing protein [Glaciecola sp. XM2]
MIHSKHMLTSICFASFLESTVVPIPLETALIPLMQARREKLWMIATVTTIGCLIGAVIGYVVGLYLFDWLREPIMQYITNEQQFAQFQTQIEAHGFWFIFSTGVTPIPLQVAMLLAGLTDYSFALYMLAVASSRCVRYFGIAILVYYFGNKAEEVIRRHKYKALIGISIILVAIVLSQIWLA